MFISNIRRETDSFQAVKIAKPLYISFLWSIHYLYVW